MPNFLKLAVPVVSFVAGTTSRMIVKEIATRNEDVSKIDQTLSGWVGASAPILAGAIIRSPYTTPFALGFSTPSLIALAGQLNSKLNATPDANALTRRA